MRPGTLSNVYLCPIIVVSLLLASVLEAPSAPRSTPRITVLCYMNGDNDLSSEVLHAIDMLETAGSSDQVDIVALADGHPDWLGSYAKAWQHSRLIHITRDDAIGVIRSTVLEEWQEADLGAPETVRRFVETAMRRFPADRYLFLMFAHGRGIIDTKQLDGPTRGKRLSISRDATNHSRMSLPQFNEALGDALAGQTFELTVLSSCLSNMVEIGYELSGVTRFLIASQDEIHLLNDPPGTYQLRGIKFEKILSRLHENPDISMKALCRAVIDDSIADYLPADEGKAVSATNGRGYFPATLAAVDCRKAAPLAAQLDRLALLIMDRLESPGFLKKWKNILGRTQRYPSFLNLEYYDLGDLAETTIQETEDIHIRRQCLEILSRLDAQLIIHEKHTPGRHASGVSIYISNPLVPQNIFDVHQSLYSQCRFSRDTRWDEMIGDYQRRIDQPSPKQ